MTFPGRRSGGRYRSVKLNLTVYHITNKGAFASETPG